MENADSIAQAIGAILAILLSGFAMFKVSKSADETAATRKAVKAITKHAHEVIEVEAEEDQEEVTEALKKDDKAAAIADLFNDRVDS